MEIMLVMSVGGISGMKGIKFRDGIGREVDL